MGVAGAGAGLPTWWQADSIGRMTRFTLPRPTSGDIIDLIIDDHRVMESLLRDVRDSSGDREAARQAYSALLVAHSVAEEEEVYPTLRTKTAQVGEHEVEHGEEEHAEGLAALLELLEAKGTDTQKYDDAAEKASNYLYHHVVEEELTILNPARSDLSDAVRADLGAKFLARRSALLDEDCGDIETVRRLVARAVKDDTIPSADLPESPGH
ncbi:hypothetical protein GCM10025883_12050 [Mobilicoccus caccae]|uniref:Hemerythrin-like domain-containing protein n=2 Tax=Mobilicoccus caccae TaxID=1859295 RepID=A0ABQ6IMK0_9MICO|nr:hypothetical protein GCM10025883_12050 [Mobilicoccus caccae]